MNEGSKTIDQRDDHGCQQEENNACGNKSDCHNRGSDYHTWCKNKVFDEVTLTFYDPDGSITSETYRPPGSNSVNITGPRLYRGMTVYCSLPSFTRNKIVERANCLWPELPAPKNSLVVQGSHQSPIINLKSFPIQCAAASRIR